VDRGQLRTDPELDRTLGATALADLAELIEPSRGECDACHQLLGTSPVALTVRRTSDPSEAMTVLPTHAACRPAGLETYRPGCAPPTPQATFMSLVFAMPVTVEVPARRRRPWSRPTTTMQQAELPAMLVNPSLDIQTGFVVDGAWRGQWERSLDVHGLTAITDEQLTPPDEPVPWSIELDAATGDVLVTTPIREQYSAPTGEDFRRLLAADGRCLVFVSDTARYRDGRLSMAELGAARRAGRLFAAWAGLGQPAAVQPLPGADSTSVPDGAQALADTGELAEAMADTSVEVRASFSGHPAVDLTGVELPEPAAGPARRGVPVLLLEPRTTVAMRSRDGVAREVHAENAIAAGLERARPDQAVLLNPARGWSLRHTAGAVELRTPAGAVMAHGRLRTPPGWADAAEALGAVLVLYGTRVGVRPTPGRPYNDDDRRAEIHHTRELGAAAWGLVAWNPAT
jgi:hypothetical protein